jgi:hypothetical protein
MPHLDLLKSLRTSLSLSLVFIATLVQTAVFAASDARNLQVSEPLGGPETNPQVGIFSGCEFLVESKTESDSSNFRLVQSNDEGTIYMAQIGRRKAYIRHRSGQPIQLNNGVACQLAYLEISAFNVFGKKTVTELDFEPSFMELLQAGMITNEPDLFSSLISRTNGKLLEWTSQIKQEKLTVRCFHGS